MAKANRLYNRIEPFAALFWALGNVLARILKQVTQPAGLASLNSRTGTDCTAGVRFNLTWKKSRPFLFPL